MKPRPPLVLLLLACFPPVLSAQVQRRPASAPPNAPAGWSFRQVAPDGAWCWFGDPRAVYHAGVHRRTYVGWVTAAGDICVGALDHDTGKIETATLCEKLDADDHANPAILVRPDGRLMVFHTAHSHASVPMRVSISTNPEDISAWRPAVEIRANTPGNRGFCYPNPVQLSAENNRIYLFWRGGNWKPNYATSDDGFHWSPPRTLIEGRGRQADNRPYCKFATNGRDRFDVAFTTGHPRNEPHNSIYYAACREGTLFRADGTRVQTLSDGPLSFEDADLVYDGAARGARAWIWDIAIDPQGRPVLVYAVLPAESRHLYHYARWDGQRWIDHEICTAGGWFPQTPVGRREREPHYSGGVILDHENPSVVYLSRPHGGTFEIERWTTRDGGATWRSEQITDNSRANNVRPFVARFHPPTEPGLFWMRGQYVHYTNFHTAIMMGTRTHGSK